MDFLYFMLLLCCIYQLQFQGIRHQTSTWCTRIHVGRTLIYMKFKNEDIWGWRDSSVVKSAPCSCREPRISSQYLLGISQPPVTPVPDYPLPSSDLHRLLHKMWCMYLHTCIHRYTENRWTVKDVCSSAAGPLLWRVSQWPFRVARSKEETWACTFVVVSLGKARQREQAEAWLLRTVSAGFQCKAWLFGC